MELKVAAVGILLLFLILAPPCFPTGRSHVESVDKEVYVIDYRGPETHTYFPPPTRAEDRPKVHRRTRTAHQERKAEGNAKKNHGRLRNL